MSNTEDNRRAGDVRRRTVLKGAAWSVPVVAAAVALPTSVASVTDCDCFKPVPYGPAGVTVSMGNDLNGGKGTATIMHGMGVNSTACQHQDLSYYMDTLGATLTMSRGLNSTAPKTYVGQIITGGGASYGFISDSLISGNMQFTDVELVDGDYDHFHGTPPMVPTAMTVTLQFRWDGKVCVKTFTYPLSYDSSSGEVRGGKPYLGNVTFDMDIAL